eukprot:TRINITY_DN38288_c0_g1_i1.p2 TRINITY_DN38288_c0_g1~~TRINITY_DN38288_c0_g1_i1.p2  ORF type:complete len:216 (-),score=40.62 TRINITY_DN38288_c0_g1_i1:115-762(-)
MELGGAWAAPSVVVKWNCRLPQPARSFPQLRCCESPPFRVLGIDGIQLKLEPNICGKVHLGIAAPRGLDLQFVVAVSWADDGGTPRERGRIEGAHCFQGGWISEPVAASLQMGSLHAVLVATFRGARWRTAELVPLVGDCNSLNDKKRADSRDDNDMDVDASSDHSSKRQRLQKDSDDADICSLYSMSSPEACFSHSSPEVEILRHELEHAMIEG